MSAYQFWREMDAFKHEKLNRLPKLWRDHVHKRYAVIAKTSLRDANLYLRELVEPLEGAIDIGASDDDLISLAAKCANQCQSYFADHKINNLMFEFYAYGKCMVLSNAYNVRYPIEFDLNQQRARLCCESWWLRNLRNSHAKAREAAARDAGIVHKKHDVYVSDDTLDRRKQQLKRNAELLQSVEMRNEYGEIMKLSDIAAAGMANHKNRFAELMARVKGFEELANKYGHKSTFATLTTPSRMHARTSDGKENAKYDGTQPDEAQKYLVNAWAKARALLAKHGVKFYGLRVAEPHHDGTPHWHMILWYDGKPSTLKKLKHYITQKFIETDREELSRDISPRVKFKDMDKRGAAGYVVKYVAKNLGGVEGESDDEVGKGSSSETNAARVEAWASTWRIRQFQQIGGHSVTAWREVRRIDENQTEGKRPLFVKLWQSAQKTKERDASFAAFIEAMGGLYVSSRESVFKVDYDVIEKQGKYGLISAFKVLGVRERFGFDVMATNRKEWVRV